MTDRLYQMDSETAVLSLILKNPSLINNTDGLRFFMFSSNAHIALYQEFEEALDKRLSPDPTLIIGSLESKNMLDRVGGKKYIDILLSKDFSESSFPEYANLVKGSYKARSYKSILSDCNSQDLNMANIDERIYSTKKSLEGLMEEGGTNGTIHIGDIANKAYEEIMARTLNPGVRGISWGIPALDKATGGKAGGDFWVIGARPGHGKTALVCNSVYNDALLGVPSLLIEREMRNQELFERLICIDTGIPNTNIRLGILDQRQVEQIRESALKIKKYPIYLETNYKASDPFYLETTIKKFHNKYGIRNVYVDYVQLLSERDETQTQEIGRLTRMFKLLVNELSICAVALSQLNRGVESRDNKRPLLSDFKQSGSIEEDTDYSIGLYRDEHYNKETKFKGIMEFIVLKNRNGPPGTIPLTFDGPTYRIGEA